jgi:hypothetical protein
MSYIWRGRRRAYDNIASGSDTGRENTARAAAPATPQANGGVGTSTTDAIYSNIVKAERYLADTRHSNLAQGVITPTSAENVG